MAFLSIRMVATAVVKSGSSGSGSRILQASSSLVDQQLGLVSRFSALAGRQNFRNEPCRSVALSGCNQKVATMIPSRGLALHEITRSLQVFTEENRKIEKDPKTLHINLNPDKPTVFMICWLGAKQKHLKKYVQLYIDQGFEVVAAHITPWQLLWPMKGSQLVAAEIVQFLKNNEFKNGLIIHGFSVGGYVWGECLVHIARDLNQYQVVLDRVKGQIWDSAADITEIPVGVPMALFPQNPTLQTALRKYMLYHMKAFHEPATSHYIRSSQMFHTNLLRCPALFLVSKTDPVGTELANGRVRDSWESSGVKCTFKVWDRSPHVGHFLRHPEEYVELVFAHLRPLDLAGTKQALRAKL